MIIKRDNKALQKSNLQMLKAKKKDVGKQMKGSKGKRKGRRENKQG